MSEAHPGERLAKRIANAGVCSRRDAEKLIEMGKVKVDGKVVKTPALNVTEANVIEVSGEVLAHAGEPRLWLYYKPAGLVTTHRDEEGRATVFDNLPGHLPRVISVGRLDINTEGLLLLTNSGDLARHLELPSTGWDRYYRARIFGDVTPAMQEKFKKGLTIDGVRYGSVDVTVDSKQKSNTWVTVKLSEGKNREIRKLFEHFGCSVSRLMRLAYGPFQLGAMKEGEVKEVPAKALRDAMGKQKADDR
jgi:23S rRNA pseudouridine2605 synthase